MSILYPTPTERAARVRPVVQLYAAATGANPEEEGWDTLIEELMADLLHLATVEGHDPAGRVLLAMAYYDEEVAQTTPNG